MPPRLAPHCHSPGDKRGSGWVLSGGSGCQGGCCAEKSPEAPPGHPGPTGSCPGADEAANGNSAGRTGTREPENWVGADGESTSGSTLSAQRDSSLLTPTHQPQTPWAGRVRAERVNGTTGTRPREHRSMLYVHTHTHTRTRRGRTKPLQRSRAPRSCAPDLSAALIPSPPPPTLNGRGALWSRPSCPCPSSHPRTIHPERGALC